MGAYNPTSGTQRTRTQVEVGVGQYDLSFEAMLGVGVAPFDTAAAHHRRLPTGCDG